MKTPISLVEAKGSEVAATDGPVGKVKDFYFDDRTWTIKYIVVNTGKLALSRDVLIPPQSVEKPGRWTSTLFLKITRDAVERSPDIDTDKPVSRQREVVLRYHDSSAMFFSWGESLMGSHNFDFAGYDFPAVAQNKNGKGFDPHLYSVNDVTGVQVNSPDGKCGHAREFVIDDETWTIRYMVVETGNIFGSRKVIVSPADSAKMGSDGDAIQVNILRDKVRELPHYDPWTLDLESWEERTATRERRFP